MPSTDLRGLSILVVEDDDDARELISTALEHYGAVVVATASVPSAREAFAARRFDVIVSDIAMPDEDGVAFIEGVRSMSCDNGGRTPAIAVSAFVGTTDSQRAKAAGFDRYLHKPVDFAELAKTARELAG